MGFRIVNGNAYTEDGWRCCDRDECLIVKIPDLFLTDTAPVRKGPPHVILGAWMFWYDRNVEEITTPIWGWTQDNDVLGRPGMNNGSNHLGGTAIDINAPRYPWGSLVMPADKVAKVREGLRLFEDSVFWGRGWNKPDEMHYQMHWGEGDARNDAFAKKLLDGYLGIYKPGTPPPQTNAAHVLARATGISLDRAIELLPRVSFALVKSNCNNPRRIAAALAQWVIESGHFKYTEEIASGPEDQERWKYKGRTWIQLTWLENYRGFGTWASGLGLVPYPDYFVDRPKELAEQKWAALGPAYWWAIKYPQINEYADRGDIDNVSKWVNAPAWVGDPNKHANGEAERRAVYNTALALGDQLLSLVSAAPPGEEELSAEAERKIDLILDFLTKPRVSASPVRPLGQGPVGSLADFILWTDGSEHLQVVKLAAELGHPGSLGLLREVAGADLIRYPDREDDAQMAQAILAELESKEGPEL